MIDTNTAQMGTPMDTDEGLTVDLTPVEEKTTEAEMAEIKALLVKAGLDHVPTIEEAKAHLDARRKEIRLAVLEQADERSWCEDGTRKVCANLRLERPGSRSEKLVEVELILKVTIPVTTYTDKGVVAHLKSKGILSSKWMTNQLYVRKAEVTPTSIVVNGNVVDVATVIQEEKPEVYA